MATFKTLMADGRETPVTAGVAGVVVTQTAKLTMPAAGAAADVALLGILPGGAVVDCVDVVADGTAVTAGIGFLATDGTVGAELTTATARLWTVAKAEQDRVVGYTLAGALVAGKVVDFRIQYHY